jgi:ribosomal protein S18 acetylase RimI-like enzyme
MVRIRPAESTDIAEIARVWRAGWLDAHVGHVPEALLAVRTEEYFVRTSTERVDSTRVAVDDDDVVLGVVLVDGDELFQLAVTSQARGLGVGQALVTAAEELIATAHDRAELAVVPGNTTARHLYERCGWTDQGEVTFPARPGEVGGAPVPVVVRHYVKQLR